LHTGDFWIALTVFHGRLVAFSFQLSEAENVVKAQDAKVSPKSHSPQQHSIVGEQVEPRWVARFVCRLLPLLNSSRTPLAQMNSARCSVGAAFVDGKIIVCGKCSAHISEPFGNLWNNVQISGGYDRGKCLKSVEEYDLATGGWRRLPDMMHNRGRFDAAVVAGRVYAVAGAFLL
uniref:F-box/kelch-repeat protein n=1 Tax=Gongylonema pulchrum TaxID=637853 RepID=A0A183D0P6_9BILA